jgi:hypothetical protein
MQQCLLQCPLNTYALLAVRDDAPLVGCDGNQRSGSRLRAKSDDIHIAQIICNRFCLGATPGHCNGLHPETVAMSDTLRLLSKKQVRKSCSTATLISTDLKRQGYSASGYASADIDEGEWAGLRAKSASGSGTGSTHALDARAGGQGSNPGLLWQTKLSGASHHLTLPRFAPAAAGPLPAQQAT